MKPEERMKKLEENMKALRQDMISVRRDLHALNDQVGRLPGKGFYQAWFAALPIAVVALMLIFGT